MINKNVGIYLIKNKKNGKVYVGQSKNIKNRIQKHKYESYRDTAKSQKNHLPLYRSMRKHGLDSFSFKVLKNCKTEDLDKYEDYYIEKYKAADRRYGYNIKQSSERQYSQEQNNRQLAIKKHLHERHLTRKEIAKLMGVSESTVMYINDGSNWYSDDIRYPIRPIGLIEEVDDTDPVNRVVFRRKLKNYCQQCGDKVGLRTKTCKNCIDIKSEIRRTTYKGKKIDPEVLLQKVLTSSLSEVAEAYKVPRQRVKDWLVYYGYTSSIRELKLQYGVIRPKVPKQPKYIETRQIYVKDLKTGSEYRLNDIEQVVDLVMTTRDCTNVRTNVVRRVDAVLVGHRQTYLSYKFEYINE